jgi:hypothetical protein
MTADAERGKVTPAAARRLVGLVTAAWATFDGVAAASPAELRRASGVAAVSGQDDRPRDRLRKRPTRKPGVKHKQPAIDDIAAIEELREAIFAVVGSPSDGSPEGDMSNG